MRQRHALSNALSVACLLASALPAAAAGPDAPMPSYQRDLPVCTVAGQTLRGDLARPSSATQRHRALLFVHGGGWSTGSRRDFEALARALALQGYTGLTVDYRLSPAVRHPQHLEDVRCALNWLRREAAGLAVDPERIGIIGASAGAHLAALLAYAEPAPGVAAVVLHGGPHDLNVLPQLSAAARGSVHALLGRTHPPDEQLRQASPVEWVRPGATPTLILHGELDPVVPVDQAYRLAAALRRVNATHHLAVIPGAGHADFGAQPDAIGRLLATFLSTHLR